MGWKSVVAGALLAAIAVPAAAQDVDGLAAAFNGVISSKMKGVETRFAFEKCVNERVLSCDYNAGPHVKMSASAQEGSRKISFVFMSFDLADEGQKDWGNAVGSSLMVFSPDASNDELLVTMKSIVARVVKDGHDHNPTILHGSVYQAGQYAWGGVWFMIDPPK